jgi:hypothetical protein
MRRYPRIYAMLKAAGHPPFKAAEMILDAARGNRYAILWIKIIWHGRRV